MNCTRPLQVCPTALLAMSFVLAVSSHLEAGWILESPAEAMENNRNHANPIALVTLHDVRQLSQAEVHRHYGRGFMSNRPAFAMRAKFVEVLRGAPAERPLEIPFVFVSLDEDLRRPLTPAQRAKLLEGGNAVLCVDHNPVYKNPPAITVWPVSSLESDDRVKFWRKVTALWNMPEAKQRRQALLDGCRDPLPEFQDYCLQRLANWEGRKPDKNAAEQLDLPSALPVVWERFVDPATPFGVLATCDRCLSKMSPGWRTHPARYDVMARALRRHSALKPTPKGRTLDRHSDSQLFESKLMALSHVPGRERQTYDLFLEIINADQGDYRSQTLSHMAHLYRPHSLDPQQQQLNREIWDRLATALANAADTHKASSAGWAISMIARDYSYLGGIPQEVATALDTELKVAPGKPSPLMDTNIGFWFKGEREALVKGRPVATVVERKRREGYTDLTVPTKSQVGRKVVLVVTPGYKEFPVFGYWSQSSWRGWQAEPVWFDKPPTWPKYGDGVVVVTGTLAERNDVPTFPLNLVEPFASGLPVPPGYDAAEIRRRYVLTDAQGEMVEVK